MKRTRQPSPPTDPKKEKPLRVESGGPSNSLASVRPKCCNKPKLQEVNIEDTWADFEKGITQVYSRDPEMAVTRYVELYQ